MKLPEYGNWKNVPDNLKTKTGLGKMALKLAPTQEPVAIKTHWHYSIEDYFLYEVSEAIPKRKPTHKQRQTLEKARRIAMTTKCCHKYVGMINWRYRRNLCFSCYAELQEERHLYFLKETRFKAIKWARKVTADDQAVILDTETTGLYGELIEIAVINMADQIRLNTRLNPISEIETDATQIHGITNKMLTDEPSFTEIYDGLRHILESATVVVIYNADFDDNIIANTCNLHMMPTLNYKSACAMFSFAEYFGEWSDYHASFRWQPLPVGDHTALGDARATLMLLNDMAESSGE